MLTQRPSGVFTYKATPGELNVGFWKFLLAKRYEAILWTGYLRHAVPNLTPQKRETVYRVLDWIDTDLRVWAVTLSRLQPIVAARPHHPSN